MTRKLTTGIWRIRNTKFTKDRGKVFSCFSCCGGSTMGYKLAGYDVIGCNEIDPKVIEIYKANHNPRFAYNCSIRDLINIKDLPDELFNLDILDGSPPCTSFSVSGVRDRDWGKAKKFSEGQAFQRLDDLFFEFIKLAERLKPKVVVAENVVGLIQGKAKGYVKEILKAYKMAGYNTQMFRLNSADTGVCQSRPRIFFISFREDLKLSQIKLNFREEKIPFHSIEKLVARLPDDYFELTARELELWQKCRPGGLFREVHPTGAGFALRKLHRSKPCSTIMASSFHYHYSKPRTLSQNELLACSSFPMDYNWGSWGLRKKLWAMGMSVPPFLIERISNEIYNQWLSNETI